MEAVSGVYESYRKEFEDTFEGIRQRSQGLSDQSQQFVQEIPAQIEPQKQELINAIVDTSDVQTPAKPVVETMGWATVLLLGASVGSIAGAYVFSPIFGLFIGRVGAALAAFVGLPIYAHMFVRRSEQESESSVRFGLLAIALVQGLLSGYVLSHTYLSAQPAAFLTPLVLTLVFPIVSQSLGSSRVNLLAASLAAALAVNVLGGLVLGLLTASYLFLSLLYVAAAGATLQLLFKNVQSAEARVHVYQLAMLTSFLLAKAVVFGLFGGPAEISEVQKPQQQPTPAK